jgi:WD40 repeat protein
MCIGKWKITPGTIDQWACDLGNGTSFPSGGVSLMNDGIAGWSGTERLIITQANWNTALQTFEGHTSLVYSVAFSPDGKQAVSGSYNTTVRLWDAVTGTPLQVLEGHTSSVRSAAFSPDGKRVVSGSYNNMVQLWDTIMGALLQVLKGHTGSVSSEAFLLDGK